MKANRGFTLLELLVVLAIMGILLAIFVSSFRWSSTQQFETSVNGVQNLLAYAQSQAVARNTYVWVGFINTTSPTGLPELAGAAAYSPDGTSAPTTEGTTTLTAPLALTKVYRWPNIFLTDDTSLNAAVQALLPSAETETGTVSLTDYVPSTTPPAATFFPAMGQPAFYPAPTGSTFYSVTFTPQGEAMLTPQPAAPPASQAASGYEPFIDLGLRRTVGTSTSAISGNPDDIILRIYGGSGKIREFRLQ